MRMKEKYIRKLKNPKKPLTKTKQKLTENKCELTTSQRI